MKNIFFIVLTLILSGLHGQTKNDRSFKNMETYDYSGLSKESIRFRIANNKNEDHISRLKETPDTFFVRTAIFFEPDTIRIKYHILTFDKDTCIRDASIFLFTEDYDYEIRYYSRACCVSWVKTNVTDQYLSTFRYKKLMTIKKTTTKPFLTITYDYLPKLKKAEYDALLKGDRDW